MTADIIIFKIKYTKKRRLFLTSLFAAILFQSHAQNADSVIAFIKPDSIYSNGRNYELFDSTARTKRWAIGGHFFIGYGVFNGNISNSFSNPIYVGYQPSFHRKRLMIQLDDYIGFCKVKKTLNYDDSLEWTKNKSARSFLLGANIGYSIIDSKKYNLTLITGIGANLMTAPLFKPAKDPKNEPSLPYYKFGFSMDFKKIVLGSDHIRLNNTDVYYTSLRISFGLNYPTRTPRYSQYYSGYIFYFTIGTGGIQRAYCTKDECRL